jgi:predicted NUDIX family NTP pyrophosphohydrolase
VKKADNNNAVHVLANGIDADYFNLSNKADHALKAPVPLFTGVMNYFPNIDVATWFC